LATDLAAAKHESLTAASTQLARAVNGSTRLLKEFGITVPKVGTKVGDFATKTDQANYIVAELSSRLHGEASAAANTFMGHIHALTAVIEDHAAAIGQKWGPALTGIGSAVTVVSTAYKTYESILARAKAAQEAQTVVTEEQTVATEGLTVAETAADGAGAPIALIVIGIAAAVAALALAAYEVYRHWKTIWGGIKDAVSAVWDWIKHNWPLLVGIILGPIGIIASQIYMHWDTIKSTFIDAFEAIKAYVLGLPAWFGRLFTNVGTAIVDALKAAFNAVAGLWNHSVGSLSFKVPGWVPFVGGDKFSVPQIPHLAQGGLITQTGFVYAHAGEAITPANKALGPAVHIEHAQFNEPVDLDLLIKRVEFALTAGLPV
jgi:hypothetical protein